jgi:hypothetical protein
MDACNPTWSRLVALALAVAGLGLWAPAGRAEPITPDSVRRPPPADVAGPVWSFDDVVTGQYAGLGLSYPFVPDGPPPLGEVAVVTRVGGADAWSPASRTEAMAFPAVVDYGLSLSGQLVVPGTPTPAAAASLTVEVVGGGPGALSAFDGGGRLVGVAAAGPAGPHGGTLLTVSGAGITSFRLSDVRPAAGPGPVPAAAPWGVAQVEFTPPPPLAAPEPGVLALAGLGVLGLSAGAWGRRRAWTTIAK